jgi:hypothetical protein
MYTWLSDYAAKLFASGLIKREKLMSGFTSPLNWLLVRYRFDGAKMGYNGRIKREKKVLLSCTLLMVRSRTGLVISVLLEVYAVRSINFFVFILLDVAF